MSKYTEIALRFEPKVTLKDLMAQERMKPSGKSRGKGPVAERHLLAYKCQQAGLQKRSGPWEWRVEDPELDQVQQFLRDYKSGERCPSGWTQSTALMAAPVEEAEVDDDGSAEALSDDSTVQDGEKRELTANGEDEEADDDDDTDLVVDGVTLGTDRRAEADDALRDARNGVPAEIDIYWPDDYECYTAKVLGYDELTGKHTVHYYIDKQEEELNLRSVMWYPTLPEASAEELLARINAVYEDYKQAKCKQLSCLHLDQQAGKKLWAKSYVSERDTWERYASLCREIERDAREERMAKRAQIRAARSAAKEEGRQRRTAIVVAPKGEEASEQAEEESNASAAPALVDMSLELQLQELREWRSGKRRRVEGVDVEAGGAFSLVTTSETTAAGSSSSSSNRGGTSMTAQLSDKLIKVKKEAAEGEEDADKLVSQQHRFIDFMQGKIDELKELALAGGTPQKHRVAEIVNRTWHE